VEEVQDAGAVDRLLRRGSSLRSGSWQGQACGIGRSPWQFIVVSKNELCFSANIYGGLRISWSANCNYKKLVSLNQACRPEAHAITRWQLIVEIMSNLQLISGPKDNVNIKDGSVLPGILRDGGCNRC
jgi:hypothetical protein